MTKAKEACLRRQRGIRKRHPSSPAECRLRAPRCWQAGGRRQWFQLLFEHIGGYDDVLVSFKYKARLGALKALLAPISACGGWWDAEFRSRRIHPGYADRLAGKLRRHGCIVVNGGDWR